MRRTEPCVCGGSITADDSDWEAVAVAVRRHQASPRHGAWRLGYPYRPAIEPADWHYIGGRITSALVPYVVGTDGAQAALLSVDEPVPVVPVGLR